MENRRAIYNHRHKVKNTHAKYKLNKGEHSDRIEQQQKKGGRLRGPIEDVEPASYTKNPKTVVSEDCVICFYPFNAPSIICPNCHNCQSCGQHNEDAYANACIYCGNHISGPRLDADVPRFGGEDL